MLMADLKKPENIMELIKFQRDLMKKYFRYINDLVKSQYKKAALLSYWLRDYLHFLQTERDFNPSFNMAYQRGQIVYVNFGYRIGSELGGARYAIVLDVHNARSNSQLTVIPMKRKREKATAYSTIYHVDLYNEISLLLQRKSLAIIDEETIKIQSLIEEYGMDGLKKNRIAKKELAKSKRRLTHAQEIKAFMETKMSSGSIADVGQICTISKMRIIHPLKNTDVLFDIRLSDEIMSRLEDKIRYLYLSKEKVDEPEI